MIGYSGLEGLTDSMKMGPLLTGQGYGQYLQFQSQMDASQMQTLKLQEQIMSMEGRQLANQKLALDLEQTRKKAADEVKTMERMSELMDGVTAITDDPSKDAYDKAKDLMKIQMGLPSYMQKNASIQNLFSFAGSSVKLDAERKEKEERKATAEESRKLGIMSQLGQIGAVDAVTELAGEEVDEFEQPYIKMAEEFKKRGETATAAKQQEAFEKARSKQISAFSDLESKVLSFAPETVKSGWDGMSVPTSSQSVTDIAAAIPQKQWTEQDKDNIAEYYKHIMELSGNRVDPDLVRQADTSDLYRSTIAKVLEHKRILGAYGLGQSSSQNTINNLFNE